MNTNELIEYAEKDSEFLKNNFPYKNDTGAQKHTEFLDSVIRELSRTRIRETATEPPTREDEYVLGFDSDIDLWQPHSAKYIIDDPPECRYWMPMPQPPEVNP